MLYIAATVKPLSLMRHLVKLLCPREGLILDPFSGTGSTAVAAVMEGRDCIAVDRDERYARHAKLRLDAIR